jgi:hypothetical protein
MSNPTLNRTRSQTLTLAQGWDLTDKGSLSIHLYPGTKTAFYNRTKLELQNGTWWIDYGISFQVATTDVLLGEPPVLVSAKGSGQSVPPIKFQDACKRLGGG